MEKDETFCHRLKLTFRRMQRARKFPDNTCPASRHVQALAEAMAAGLVPSKAVEDPEHVAESLAATLQALYSARSKLQQLGYDWTVAKNGRIIWWKK